MNSLHTYSLAVDSKCLLADLVLIGVDKNLQHVRAVASNYRHNSIIPSTANPPSIHDQQDFSSSNNAATAVGVNTTVFDCGPFLQDLSVVEIVPIPASTSTGDKSRARHPSPQVTSTCDFINSAMGPTQIHMDVSVKIEELLGNRNLIKVTARGDGHCLLHAWSTATNTSEQAVKQQLVQEFDTNIVRYSDFG